MPHKEIIAARVHQGDGVPIDARDRIPETVERAVVPEADALKPNLGVCRDKGSERFDLISSTRKRSRELNRASKSDSVII